MFRHTFVSMVSNLVRTIPSIWFSLPVGELLASACQRHRKRRDIGGNGEGRRKKKLLHSVVTGNNFVVFAPIIDNTAVFWNRHSGGGPGEGHA